MTEADAGAAVGAGALEEALIVRTPMRDRVGHAMQSLA